VGADSVIKMKRMTPAKNLSCTYLAMFVVTMVCLSVTEYGVNEADNVLAHRQCARNANALKSEDGTLRKTLYAILFDSIQC